MTIVPPPNDMASVLDAVGKEMLSELAKIRAKFKNTTDVGTGTESAIRVFLREYLPRILEVGTGEVIDSYGSRSPQTDVVIVTEDHPFTFRGDSPGLFFVEGVGAAAEVKTQLTTAGIVDACDKSKEFKNLRAAPFTGLSMSKGSDKANHLGPPYFLFAFESEVTLDLVCEKVRDYQAEHAIKSGDFLDAVFVLDRGAVIDLGDGTGPLKLMQENGSEAVGWVTNQSGNALFDLLIWLSVYMPKRVRMDSILSHYLLPSLSTSQEANG